ncbi:MAG: AMP-binding protein [Thermovirgaceae bacterium]|nr:AMP-binding protein [Thermovirgaceae bacterium]
MVGGFSRLDEIISSRLAKDPETHAVWWKGSWMSGAGFMALVRESEESLRQSGFRPGSRIAVFLPNSPLLWSLAVAAWRLGGAIAPLNARSGINASVQITEHIDPIGAVLGDGMENLAGVLMENGIPSVIASPEGPLPMFIARMTKPEDEGIAVIFATSGTTGAPKAVEVSHANLIDNSLKVYQTIEGFESGRVLLNVLPNFHSLGFTICGVLPLCWGLPMVVVSSFIPVRETLEALQKAEVSIMIAVPTMLPFLMGAVSKEGLSFPSLKYILTGGGKLDPTLEGRIRKEMGVICFEGYGLTESSPVVSCNPSEKTRKLGTVGPPLPGYEVQIRDIEGNVLRTGEEGVLWVKGPSVTSGYFRAPDLTAERFHDGWLDTGDIVKLDEDGFITILDRATDLIIVGGFNVYPQEVETVLNSHPSVKMSAAVGISSAISGEVVKAFVVPHEHVNVTQQELVLFAKEHLAHYKVPRRIDIVQELPLSSTGKILKRQLREMESETTENPR